MLKKMMMMVRLMRPTPFYSYWYCSTRAIGMLSHNSTSRHAFLHSQSSTPIQSGRTHQGNRPFKPIVSNNVEDALKVFDEMLQLRHLPSVVRFNQVLGQLAKRKHYSLVLSMSRQMGLIGMASDAFTLTIIINCYCHLNQMGFGLSVLTFVKSGLQPNVATFNTLIHGFILENRVADAARIFSRMLVGGSCQPNVVTFNTLINGFCLKGDNMAAIQLLGKMEERGCEPNIIAYSTIIDSLCKDRLVDEALNLLTEMMTRGIAPNVVTYTSLTQGVCSIGRWKEAVRLINEMVSQLRNW